MKDQLLEKKDVLRKLYKRAEERGLPKPFIVPLLANIAVETGYTIDPTTRQREGGKGYGLAQWEKGTVRHDILTRIIKEKKGDIGGLMDQWDYILDNFLEESAENSTQNWAGYNIQDTFINNVSGSVKDITRRMSDTYFRPGKPNIEDRDKAAEIIEEMSQGWSSKSTKKEKVGNHPYPFWDNENISKPKTDGKGNFLAEVPRTDTWNEKTLEENTEDVFKKEAQREGLAMLNKGGSLLDYSPTIVSTSNTPVPPATPLKNNVESPEDVTAVDEEAPLENASTDWASDIQKMYSDIRKNRQDLSDKLSFTPKSSGEPIGGSEAYESAWKSYLAMNPEHEKYKNILSRLAKKESNFKNVQNYAGAPAYGYFQLWKTNLQGATPEEFLRDPIRQISSAIQLLKNNLSTFTDKDREKAKSLGYDEDSMLAGAWLGGVGGVRDFLHRGISRSDKHHYGGKGGDDVESRMKSFMLKEGGSIDTDNFPIKIGDKSYSVKIAESEEEKSIGLSKDTELSEDSGMLFILTEEDKDEEGLVWFTMEDTKISLDIIFIDENFEVVQVSKGEPLSTEPVYGKANFVLEVNPESNIVVGDVLVFKTKEIVNDKMMVLDADGNAQMTLDGGERIFSIHNTKILVRFAKKSAATKKDNDYKALGKRVFKFLKVQDNNEPEYV